MGIGDWGSGKTFFVKQCKYVLDCLNSSDDSQKGNINSEKLFNKENLDDIDKKPFRTVYYDAWEHDNETDPIQSLLACIATSNWASNPKLKDTIRKTADIGVNLLKVITPKRGEAVEDLINLVDKKAKDYKDKVDLEKLKKEFYDALVELAPEDGKLIVFVDELDRCKPTYAIKVLERIKHYFSVPNITFIFSVDLSQLQNTVKRYYGEEFDGYHYLDRFFDKVFCAHGSLYSFSLRFRSSIQTRADMRSYRSTAHTWKRQSVPAHGAGGCPARSAADTL